MAKCGSVTSKIAIFFINCLTWIVAAGFIFLGVWFLREFEIYEKLFYVDKFSFLPGILLLSVGLVLFILGLVGCIGAVKENKCIIGLYFSLLLVIMIGLVANAALSFIFRKKMDDKLHSLMFDGFNKYGENETNGTIDKMVDDLQQNMECCGVDNYTDWLDLPWHKAHLNESYPASCCSNNSCENISALHQKGCYVEIKEVLVGHLVALYSVIGFCALMLLVGMISACLLLRERRSRDFLYSDLIENDDGMRV